MPKLPTSDLCYILTYWRMERPFIGKLRFWITSRKNLFIKTFKLQNLDLYFNKDVVRANNYLNSQCIPLHKFQWLIKYSLTTTKLIREKKTYAWFSAFVGGAIHSKIDDPFIYMYINIFFDKISCNVQYFYNLCTFDFNKALKILI